MIFIVIVVTVIFLILMLRDDMLKRQYNRIATNLQNACITPPSILSFGKVTGIYKDRRVEWKLVRKVWDEYPQLEVKMEICATKQSKQNSQEADNITIKDNWKIYSQNYPLVLKKEKIIQILQTLYSGVEK